jgi:hypothetical protein
MFLNLSAQLDESGMQLENDPKNKKTDVNLAKGERKEATDWRAWSLSSKAACDKATAVHKAPLTLQ